MTVNGSSPMTIGPERGPLTWANAVQSWQLDVPSAMVIVLLAAGYAWCYRRGRLAGEAVEPVRAWCFGIGIVLWSAATLSFIGVYAHLLFWVRALQVLASCGSWATCSGYRSYCC
jgi:cytochrome c oxidase assembly factor CtaG